MLVLNLLYLACEDTANGEVGIWSVRVALNLRPILSRWRELPVLRGDRNRSDCKV
jgi:hypothetical protein